MKTENDTRNVDVYDFSFVVKRYTEREIKIIAQTFMHWD